MSQARNLRQALLAPRAVAIVGQSDDASKIAGRPLKYLRQAGFAGRVYPVNARRDRVLGEKAWRSVADLPEVPDHAYIVAPREAVVGAIEECAKLGIAVATVLADGFTGANEGGAARAAMLRDICARYPIRLVGPSSLGVVDLREKLFLTANAAFAETDMPVGHIFVASHSGSLIGALPSRGKGRGIGFAGLVSVGNEIDLTIGEICESVLDDPGIDGFLLFLENLRNADRLRAFALAAAARGKPVAAYKLGRSDKARELAVSHTGALAGEDDVADAFFADCGIARVATFEALIEGLPLIARLPIRAVGAEPATIGVVTTTAGGAAMVVDSLAWGGARVDGPGPDTLARLAAAGIDVVPGPLIDLTIAGARYEIMKAALDILTTAPEFDLLVVVIGTSARFHPELAVRPLIDSAGAPKPIAAFLVPEASEALARLNEAGVPAFHTPEACADAVIAALKRRPPKPAPSVRAAAGEGRVINELAAGALLDRIGIQRAPALALDSTIVQAPPLPFAYPVAVKILSADVPHKTEAGAVELDIADGDSLVFAISRIRDNVLAFQADARADRVLVQPMINGIAEMLIGYRIDPDVGPIVMLAAGGIQTEIYRDRSLRLAPVELAEAHVMIGEVKATRAFSGFRGRPLGDLDALAQAIVALSTFAGDPMVVEAEINPLIVRGVGGGVVAVDALVKLRKTA